MTARPDALERFLATARRSFLDVGVERTRMVDIAALAVISRPQLYRNW